MLVGGATVINLMLAVISVVCFSTRFQSNSLVRLMIIARATDECTMKRFRCRVPSETKTILRRIIFCD